MESVGENYTHALVVHRDNAHWAESFLEMPRNDWARVIPRNATYTQITYCNGSI